MKATLTFNLDDPEDRQAHLRAIKALDLVLVLHELGSKLRAVDKYGAEPLTREEFYSFLNKYGITLDELVT